MIKRSSPKTIDEYIKGYPKNIQKLLNGIRHTIKKAAPEATEKISYQIPTFYLNGNLVHFAAFRDHISFFPTSAGVEAFKDELSEYKTAKGTIQFPLDKPIPLDLITSITEYRVSQVKKGPVKSK